MSPASTAATPGTPARRHVVLGAALAATLAATAWVALQPEDDGAAATALPARRAATPKAVPTSVPTTASSPASVASAASAAAPAASQGVAPGARQPWAEASPAQLAAWQPPPPPPPPPAPPPAPAAPPPPPMAPPLPYQMIGRVVEGGDAQAVEVALLAGPNSALSVQRGDVIDGQWRVEQVSTRGVSLIWLPAQLPQNIVFKAVP